METWRRVMGSIDDLHRFIFKETGKVPSRRNPSLGPVPRAAADKPHPSKDPLSAYRISQDAKTEAERTGRTKRMVDLVAEKIGRKPSRPGDSSGEIPL